MLLPLTGHRNNPKIVGQLYERLHNFRSENIVEALRVVPVAHSSIQVDDEHWEHSAVLRGSALSRHEEALAPNELGVATKGLGGEELLQILGEPRTVFVL